MVFMVELFSRYVRISTLVFAGIEITFNVKKVFNFFLINYTKIEICFKCAHLRNYPKAKLLKVKSNLSTKLRNFLTFQLRSSFVY